MLLRRAVTAAGLAVALVGAGAGTALAADGSLLDQVTGTADQAAPSQVQGMVEDSTPEQVQDLTKQVQPEGVRAPVQEGGNPVTDAVEGVTGESNSVGNVRVPVQNGGEDPLLGESGEGLCADVASESDPPPCESDTLGSETLNACVGDSEGSVSQIGTSNGGLTETLGLQCRQQGGGGPGPGGGGGDPGGGGGPSGGFMPAPEDMGKAAPARAIEAQPTFTG